ncbi:helix-turn-helix domain-containing protein [Sphingobacterium puteale]|uniref:Helix-turn-helix domain-containing protein n=1 Tax=Sphingobacterium puteale TaxID=2420510 RepID=A0A420VRB9_9SPHI|nr:AraC family transcriptional regulator [Sphingobacterium puteale]RKO68807.1 helix-turn-helix domain-containing protein [Sphingobacterium puteale]
MDELIRYPFLHTFNPIQKINATTIKERLSRKPHQLFLPHRTDFYMIFLFTEGNGKHCVDFHPLSVKPKNILFISKGQVHNFDEKETYDGNTVVFTEEFFCRTEDERAFLHHSPLFNDPLQLAYFEVGERYQELETLYNLIIAELKRPTHPNQAQILHNYLYNMILVTELVYQPRKIQVIPNRQQVLVSEFKSLANEFLYEHWSVDNYAEKLNVSSRTLQTAFSVIEGISPKLWLNERLCLEIKRLLTFESKTINEISFLLGFKEASYFVKFFKTRTGITPSEFRKTRQF